MTFSLVNFDKLSAEANTNVRRLYAYTNLSDALATIIAADYFLSIYASLSIGDEIFVYGSDGYGTYVVTASTSSTVTVAALTSVPGGSITNNEIDAAAAIDFSKLATLASTNILVGSAGGVATSRAMTGDITIGNTGVTAIGANKVLSSMVSPLLLKYTTVAITAAEFNGMYAAPKLLLAAGGANTLQVLVQCQLLMTYVSANYAAGGVAAIQYDSTANGAGVIASTTLSAATFQAAASTGFVFNPGVVPETFSTCVNKGLYLSNITGAFTTGDSTFVAHLWYRTIPTV
jgi:hypothetical protein